MYHACSLTGRLYVGGFYQVPVDQIASAEDDADVPRGKAPMIKS